MKPTIITIGDIVADLITVVRLPVMPGELIMTTPPLFEPGGACNFGITATRLGLNISMIGAPGDDLWGRMLLEALHEEGIDTRFVTPLQGVPTTLVQVLADVDAFTQTYISFPVPSTGAYRITKAIREAISAAQGLFIQGYTLNEDYLWEICYSAMEYALQVKCPIFFDPGPLFARAPRERQLYALERADMILTTEAELYTLYPNLEINALYQTLFAGRLRELVVKRGEHGCRVVTPQGISDIPAYPVQAIGSAGAGDSFDAAYVFGSVYGWALTDRAKLANATAAIKVTRLGGGRQAPQRAEVVALLRASGEDRLANNLENAE
jgi:sugar/nucleoside kinase (ribokinase family)